MRKYIAFWGVLIFLLSLTFGASAQTNPDYGSPFFWYGKQVQSFKGNLSPSGLGTNETRPARALWHDVRFQNATTNEYAPYPGGGYIPALQFDIKEDAAAGDWAGRFNGIRGYFVLPYDKDTITRYTEYANGNVEYVLRQIAGRYLYTQNPNDPNAIPNTGSDAVDFYTIDGQPYLEFGKILYFSGGGDPVKVTAGNGVDSPLFKSTFKITPKPIIERFAAKENGQLDVPVVTQNGELYINATTYSIWNLLNDGRITVNDDPNTATSIFEKLTPSAPYTAQINQTFPISKIASSLKVGENKLTLKIGDYFGRTASASITINYQPTQEENLLIVDNSFSITPAQPQKPGIPATVKFAVKNEGKVAHSPKLAWKWSVDFPAKYIDVPDLKPGEQRTITINTVYPYKAMNFIANINYDQADPEVEMKNGKLSWEDNRQTWLVNVIRPNLKVSDVRYSPQPAKPGQKLSLSVLATNEYIEPITTDLVARANGKEIGRKTITVGAKQSIRVSGFSYTPPTQPSAKVEFEINPVKNKPNNETVWTDNKDDITIPLALEKNIGVTIVGAPDAKDSGWNFTYKIKVVNTGDTTETFTLTKTQPYKESEEHSRSSTESQ